MLDKYNVFLILAFFLLFGIFQWTVYNTQDDINTLKNTIETLKLDINAYKAGLKKCMSKLPNTKQQEFFQENREELRNKIHQLPKGLHRSSDLSIG